ncbi:glycosyltransferase family 39 protein [Propioniciclava soli]|uniref:glycosyltransferase family 39 protein n=1 Tax=Propioniciclava soli TaxID=2775081 RepID=UPI001E51D2C5|nr:glycosyltransferase family 39 protein [Propioniciclava soli]
MSVITVERRAATAGPSRAAPRRRGRPHPREGTVLFLIALLGYVVLGAFLIHHDLLFTDGLSRVGNGYYVLFSRDPHLAAVGFVWNPLPSLAAMIPLLGTPVWPDLARTGWAGVIVSAACGAGSVALISACLRRLGVGRPARFALTAAFALHPLTALSSADGASEAMFTFWCLLVVYPLLAWVRTRDPRELLWAGLALGLAYATRYEAVAPAAAVVVGVLVWSAITAQERRWQFAVNDAVLVGLPVLASFIGWAAASKLIVGEWFATFTSEYGNSAQVSAGRVSIDVSTGRGALPAVGYLLEQTLWMAPLLGALVLLAGILAWRRREARVLVPLAVFGAVLIFADLVFVLGTSFGWLRFQVGAVPLTVLLAGQSLVLLRPASRPARWVAITLPALLILVLPLQWLGMGNARIAREEVYLAEQARLGVHRTERQVADTIDALGLPDGSVATDVAYSYGIVLASRHPRSFVITPDRDFEAAIADPTGHGVRYVLLTSPEVGAADAIAALYPGLYADGADRAVLVGAWGEGIQQWRLYEWHNAP